jgi:hypothetical protein
LANPRRAQRPGSGVNGRTANALRMTGLPERFQSHRQQSARSGFLFNRMIHTL